MHGEHRDGAVGGAARRSSYLTRRFRGVRARPSPPWSGGVRDTKRGGHALPRAWPPLPVSGLRGEDGPQGRPPAEAGGRFRRGRGPPAPPTTGLLDEGLRARWPPRRRPAQRDGCEDAGGLRFVRRPRPGPRRRARGEERTIGLTFGGGRTRSPSAGRIRRTGEPCAHSIATPAGPDTAFVTFSFRRSPASATGEEPNLPSATAREATRRESSAPGCTPLHVGARDCRSGPPGSSCSHLRGLGLRLPRPGRRRLLGCGEAADQNSNTAKFT